MDVEPCARTDTDSQKGLCMSCSDFKTWFECLTDHAPHPWQQKLGTDNKCQNRLIRIPTGFGKTAGSALAWLFHRVVLNDRRWPTRLVFCLPMRVLVEQTEASILGWLNKAGLTGEVGVHVLLGGHTDRDWALSPEKPAIVVGTQDMLLSRALNRGYSASRAWWPIDFGLLNNDALWVLDEIQLMDVGLATSAQLAAFRAADRAKLPLARPFACWWMSATLQPSWLKKAIDFGGEAAELAERIDEIPESERAGGLWAIEKRLERRADLSVTVKPKKKSKKDGRGDDEGVSSQSADDEAHDDCSQDAAKLADEIRKFHQTGSLTLVVVNTVNKALALFGALSAKGKNKKAAASDEGPELVLLHSRFRGQDRRRLSEKLREAPRPAGRIVVATQVVEAGVDLSAKVLFTELAPWPSLVQRFGRAARYAGESGQVIVFGKVPTKDAEAVPYSKDACTAADEALSKLGDGCAPQSLIEFEESHEEQLARLYPYDPLHILRRRDLDGLFDTTPDLSGSDLDISRYIRSGDERDARVFWRALDKEGREIAPERLGVVERDELCPVPVSELKEHLAKKRKAWRLDYRDKVWEQVAADEIFPGMTILLDASEGGYSDIRGWDSRERGAVTDLSNERASEKASRTKSEVWQTIAEHDAAVAQDVQAMATSLGASQQLAHLLALAAELHDWGKSHLAFQAKISREARERAQRQAQTDLAKAPDEAWSTTKNSSRPGFRHELASALAILELIRRAAPDHEALSKPFAELLALTNPGFVQPSEPDAALADLPLAQELAALSAGDVNLLAFLVCAHHGKVRCAIAATADDQDSGQVRLNGVQTGDRLPAIELGGARLPEVTLDLAPAALGLSTKFGASWTERALGLREAFGPFGLAFLEALLRAADMRISKRDAPEG